MKRGFTLIELLVVVAIIGLLASIVLVILTGVQKDAHDKKRLEDLTQLQKALELYYTDHQYYPKEAAGANGDVAQNAILITMLKPYLSPMSHDPVGIGDAIFYYYYDGKAQCGTQYYAIVFARQMEKPENSNYTEYLNTSCSGTVDGEGRGGGTQSYTILLGESGG